MAAEQGEALKGAGLDAESLSKLAEYLTDTVVTRARQGEVEVL